MRLTAQVKLQPTPAQADALLRTLEAANEAANWISRQAWKTKTFAQYSLHQLVYRECRSRFGLSAQVVIRAIAKVADAYKLDKERDRWFRTNGSIAFDARILRWGKDSVSIWTVAGRQQIPFVCGERQRELLSGQRGESDLMYRGGQFYMAAACEVAEAPLVPASEYLGVDFGVGNIASDSTGRRYSGSMVRSVRHRHRRLRTRLQKKQSRAAKRRLSKLAGQERRFATHVNHVISQQIVASAKGTGRGIALEELKGIRGRVTVRRKQRAVLHSWAFSQLRLFVAYQAQRTGIPMALVDPKNTSRECSVCGHVARENRLSQSRFRCVSCGHEAHADTNAARVISGRAARKPAEGGDARLSDLCNSSPHESVKSL